MPEEDPYDRIVDIPHDRPVVYQERIGDAVQPLERLPLVGANGLIGQVAARGYYRKSQPAEQQMMKRR